MVDIKDGYIKLFRKIRDNPLWREHRTFSKAEAWIDLLMEAQHQEEPKEVVLGQRILIQNRGECLKTLNTWARRWNWSKSKTSRVLHMFQKMKMIDIKSESVTIRITLLNYATYHDWRNDDETQKKRKRNASGTQAVPNKKVNKGNNGNNGNNKTKQLHGDFVYLTDDEFKNLETKYGLEETQNQIEAMNSYAHQIGEVKFVKKYKSHYYTIINWIGRKNEKKPTKQQQSNPAVIHTDEIDYKGELDPENNPKHFIFSANQKED